MTDTFQMFAEFIRDETGRNLPTVWVICSRCSGEGTLGGWPGVYTEDDRAEWSDEDRESYCATTRHCDECGGTGKVRELPDDSPHAEAWYEWCREEAADRHTRWAESGYPS